MKKIERQYLDERLAVERFSEAALASSGNAAGERWASAPRGIPGDAVNLGADLYKVHSPFFPCLALFTTTMVTRTQN
jgi:hypothetical protein